MSTIDYDVLVDVFERNPSDVAGQLSISNIPLSKALHTILRWPQERREGALIVAPDRTIPWHDINELYRELYGGLDGGPAPPAD